MAAGVLIPGASKLVSKGYAALEARAAVKGATSFVKYVKYSEKASQSGRLARLLKPANRALSARYLMQSEKYAASEMKWGFKSFHLATAANYLSAATTINSAYSRGRNYKIF
jgi:hypothetical protein